MRFNVRHLATSGSLLIVLLASLVFVIKTPALKTLATTTANVSGVTVPKMLMPWDKSFTDAHYTGGPHGGGTITPCAVIAKNVASGIDFGMPQGTDLLAPFNAKMVFAGVFTGYQAIRGVVILQSLDQPNFYVELWHLNAYDTTLVGLNIAAGTLVGKSGYEIGSDGSQVSHLHVEFRYGTFDSNNPLNSLTPFPANGVSIDGYRVWAMPTVSNKANTLNYQGTLTKGSTTTQSIIDCGTSGTETISSGSLTIKADTSSTVEVVSTNVENTKVWRDMKAANLGDGANILYATSFDATTDGWAGGFWRKADNSANGPLLEHWSIDHWEIMNPTLNPLDGSPVVRGVSALDQNNVWFLLEDNVGYSVLQWHGNTWQEYPLALVSGMWINAFTMITADDGYAVGMYSTGGQESTLIEHWDGIGWKQMDSPNGAYSSNMLISVAGIKGNIWAVGESDGGYGYAYTLALHFNENFQTPVWKDMKSPNSNSSPGNAFNGLLAVSVSPVRAIFTGVFTTGSCLGQSIGMRYQTGKWKVTNTVSPFKSPCGYELNSVSSDSIGNAMAAGSRQLIGSEPNGLTESFDGTHWNLIPGVEPVGSILEDITSIPNNSGQYVATGLVESKAFAEIYGPTGPMTLTP